MKTHHVAASCNGKKALNFSEAKRQAKNLSRFTDTPSHHYHCTFCHAWHVGASNRMGRFRKDKEIES